MGRLMVRTRRFLDRGGGGEDGTRRGRGMRGGEDAKNN